MSSIRTTEGVLPKIANMKPLIARLLPQFPMELFDQLEDRALALGHAQTVYESAQQPPAILQTLSDEATAAHSRPSAVESAAARVWCQSRSSGAAFLLRSAVQG